MFNDFTKGPSFSVIIIGLFALAGFIGLGAYVVSDKGDNPETTLAAQENSIIRQEKLLAEIRKKVIDAKKLYSSKEGLKLIKNNIADAKYSVKKAKSSLAKKEKTFNSLSKERTITLNKVRIKVRSDAAGSSIETLTTESGTVYKNLKIRKVTPYGISVTDGYKLKTIPPSELPEEYKAMYYFDEKETKVAMEKLAEYKESKVIEQQQSDYDKRRAAFEVKSSKSMAKSKEIRKEIDALRIKIKTNQARIDNYRREHKALMAKHHKSRGLESERRTNSTYSMKAEKTQKKIDAIIEYNSKMDLKIQSYYSKLSAL